MTYHFSQMLQSNFCNFTYIILYFTIDFFHDDLLGVGSWILSVIIVCLIEYINVFLALF